MQWLTFPLTARQPLTLHSFLYYQLPPFLCYYGAAILVLLPNTLYLRLGLLVLCLLLTFQAVVRLDLTLGYGSDRLVFLDMGFTLTCLTLAMRVASWSFQNKPLTRKNAILVAPHSGQTKGHASNGAPVIPDTSRSISKQLFIDAADLCCNLRGIGWTWSPNLHIPPETRPTHSTRAFIIATLKSSIIHLIFFDLLHYGIQSFAPSTVGSPKGGSIYDTSLAPFPRYLRSTAMTFFSGFVVYAAIQFAYDVATVVAILVFKQHPLQWPPAFHAPWLSTSLTEFWAKRWHQVFRDNFIRLGGYPLSLVAGRAGAVLGSFLISAILHDIALCGFTHSDFLRVGGFFLVNGIGVLLEHVWRKMTGSRVDGFFGWVWTVGWIVGWAQMLVEAWAQSGLVGSRFLPVPWRPSTWIFGALPE